MATRPIGTGQLFPKTAKSVFLSVTLGQYNNMLARVRRKGYPGLPFDLDGYRMHVLCAMGGSYDGFFRCQYCTGFFALNQIAVDHAIPLSRGGGVDLGNLAFPCMGCNDAKGSMTPHEFNLLIGFLDSRIPLAKVDVLQRLKISVKLAAADRWRKKKQPKSDSGEF